MTKPYNISYSLHKSDQWRVRCHILHGIADPVTLTSIITEPNTIRELELMHDEPTQETLHNRFYNVFADRIEIVTTQKL